jgi:uncharacterized membrane protein YuzA (DUF378 family)
MKTIDVLAVVLLIVGGINWGLVGLLQFDLVAAIFGPMSALARIVYTVVGIAALFRLVVLLAAPRQLASPVRG